MLSLLTNCVVSFVWSNAFEFTGILYNANANPRLEESFTGNVSLSVSPKYSLNYAFQAFGLNLTHGGLEHQFSTEKEDLKIFNAALIALVNL